MVHKNDTSFVSKIKMAVLARTDSICFRGKPHKVMGNTFGVLVQHYLLYYIKHATFSLTKNYIFSKNQILVLLNQKRGEIH